MPRSIDLGVANPPRTAPRHPPTSAATARAHRGGPPPLRFSQTPGDSSDSGQDAVALVRPQREWLGTPLSNPLTKRLESQPPHGVPQAGLRFQGRAPVCEWLRPWQGNAAKSAFRSAVVHSGWRPHWRRAPPLSSTYVWPPDQVDLPRPRARTTSGGRVPPDPGSAPGCSRDGCTARARLPG